MSKTNTAPVPVTTDTVAVTKPEGVKTRSTFSTTPPPEPEVTTVDGSTQLGEKAEQAIVAEEKALGMKPPAAAVAYPRRREILDDAEDKMLNAKQGEYGDALANHERIAALWTARDLHIGNRVYTAFDVAEMMSLTKVSRLAYDPTHTDSHVDKTAYSAFSGEFAGA